MANSNENNNARVLRKAAPLASRPFENGPFKHHGDDSAQVGTGSKSKPKSKGDFTGHDNKLPPMIPPELGVNKTVAKAINAFGRVLTAPLEVTTQVVAATKELVDEKKAASKAKR